MIYCLFKFLLIFHSLWNASSCTSTIDNETLKFLQNRDQNKKYLIHAWQAKSQSLLAFEKNGSTAQTVPWLDERLTHSTLLGNHYDEWYAHVTGVVKRSRPLWTLHQDVLFQEMKAGLSTSNTFNNRVAFPLVLYVDETPFRQAFFQAMKSLAHLSFQSCSQFDTFMTHDIYGVDNTSVKVNFADFAWSLVLAIQFIRTYHTSQGIRSLHINSTCQYNASLWESLESVPFQYFHGSAPDYEDSHYFQPNYVLDSITIIMQALLTHPNSRSMLQIIRLVQIHN